MMSEEKKSGKLTSRRFWLCAWACAAITGIIIGSYIRDNYDLVGLAMALVAIPAAFVGLESMNKKYIYQQEDQK